MGDKRKMTEELQKKAEDFIIDRYKIAKCYREDNAETREYMRMDVHSQYEEEYQLYLDATKELQEENAELKDELKKWKDGIALKDEEIGCIETDFNTFKSEARELLKGWLGDFYNPKAFYQQRAELVEQSEKFIKDSEVEK